MLVLSKHVVGGRTPSASCWKHIAMSAASCALCHAILSPLLMQVCLLAVMAATLLSISLVVERLWAVFPGSPYFASLSHAGLTTLILAFGGCLGFMMVWVEFTVIQETSALTFMVAGTFKEIVTGVLAIWLSYAALSSGPAALAALLEAASGWAGPCGTTHCSR